MEKILKNYALGATLPVVLIAALLIWMTGFAFWVRSTEAANLVELKDTLSDSDLGVGSNHTVQFRPPGGVPAGGKIEITFDPSAATFVIPAALDFTDVDLAINGVDQTLATSASGATWGVSVSTSTRTITLTSGTGTIAANATTTIEIGLHATFGTTGDQQIQNPSSAGSYIIRVRTADSANTTIDSGEARVAIIDDVVLTAAVDVSLTFTISGVATGTNINGATTTRASTATTLNFGTLPVNSPVTMGQKLSVSTNARNGFRVTVWQDQNPTSAVGADIDLFRDGNATSTPSAWVSPSNILDQENTYGHYGLTSNDSNLETDTGNSADNFDLGGATLFVGNHNSSSTPRVVFAHNGPSDGITQDKGVASVAYRIEITALQEAANDYTNTLTYIATPTY